MQYNFCCIRRWQSMGAHNGESTHKVPFGICFGHENKTKWAKKNTRRWNTKKAKEHCVALVCKLFSPDNMKCIFSIFSFLLYFLNVSWLLRKYETKSNEPSTMNWKDRFRVYHRLWCFVDVVVAPSSSSFFCLLSSILFFQAHRMLSNNIYLPKKNFIIWPNKIEYHLRQVT